MTQAAAEGAPSWTVNAALAAQRRTIALGGSPRPASAEEDDAQVAVRAAVAAERARIARDLDDATCKSLLGVAMVADSLASPQWSADPRLLDARLQELARLARQAATLARCVINDLQDYAPEMARQLRAVPSAPPVRVVIADSNPLLRSGLRAVLENASSTEVVAEAASGHDVAEQVQRHRPDVLLLDARLALPDGLAGIRQFGRLTKVVMLDWADDSSLVTPAAAAGASGYAVHGPPEPGELIKVVLEAAGRKPGASPLPVPVPAGPFRAPERPEGSSHVDLRPREREIMQFIADGLSNRQIAARLVLSEKTVKNHICSIYQRLGVHGRSQAISYWRDQ